MTLHKFFLKLKGGAGSGNFGHSGRPGKRGGSSPGGQNLSSFGIGLMDKALKRQNELVPKMASTDPSDSRFGIYPPGALLQKRDSAITNVENAQRGLDYYNKGKPVSPRDTKESLENSIEIEKEGLRYLHNAVENRLRIGKGN